MIELKGTVPRDARWVENGLKRCVLTTNYITASLLFLILKRHHHKKSLKPVLDSKQQLNWLCRVNWQNPANDGLRTFSSIDLLQVTSCKLRASSYELRAASCELQASSYELQAASYKLRDMRYKLRAKRYEIKKSHLRRLMMVRYSPAPYYDCTVQTCTVHW